MRESTLILSELYTVTQKNRDARRGLMGFGELDYMIPKKLRIWEKNGLRNGLKGYLHSRSYRIRFILIVAVRLLL